MLINKSMCRFKWLFLHVLETVLYYLIFYHYYKLLASPLYYPLAICLSLYLYLELIGFDIYNKVLDYKGNAWNQNLGSIRWSESQTAVIKTSTQAEILLTMPVLQMHTLDSSPSLWEWILNSYLCPDIPKCKQSRTYLLSQPLFKEKASFCMTGASSGRGRP